MAGVTTRNHRTALHAFALVPARVGILAYTLSPVVLRIAEPLHKQRTILRSRAGLAKRAHQLVHRRKRARRSLACNSSLCYMLLSLVWLVGKLRNHRQQYDSAKVAAYSQGMTQAL